MSNAPRTEILFPAGRFVYGSLYEPKTTDAQGNPALIKNGPRKGQPLANYLITVAIPKGTETHWAQTSWGQIIWNIGHQAFPQGQAQSPQFAWKITDGDSQIPNTKGKKPIDREGYAKHWVVHFSGMIAPKIYNSDGTKELTENNLINLGDYIQVYGDVCSNDSMQSPGVYMNHRMLAFLGYGERINIAPPLPDATSVGFGGPLPVGASLTPPVGNFNPAANSVPPQMPVMPPQFAQAAVPPPPPMMPPQNIQAPMPPQQGMPVVPYTPILNGPTTQTVLHPVPPPMMPPQKIMLPAANGTTYEQYKQAGYTDEYLIAAGLLQA